MTSPSSGREAHRRVERLAVEHGRHRSAVADVAGDDLRVVEVQSREFGAGLAPRICGWCRGSRICARGISRNRRGAGRTCNSPPGSIWWNEVSKTVTCGTPGSTFSIESTPSRLAGLCSGAISNSERIFALDVLGDDAALGEELAAVGYAVADGLHLVERRGSRRAPGSVRASSTSLMPVVWSGIGLVQLERLLADGFMGQVAFREADTFHDAFCEQCARRGLHVDHLILDRRAAAVQYQNYHCLSM